MPSRRRPRATAPAIRGSSSATSTRMRAIVGARDEGALKSRLSGADARPARLGREPSIPQGGSVSAKTRMRRTLALALAGGTLAVGVPAALAAGGGSEAGSSGSGAPASGFVQDEQQQQPDQSRPGHDCPERDGAQGDGSGSGGGSGSSDSGTSTPEV